MSTPQVESDPTTRTPRRLIRTARAVARRATRSHSGSSATDDRTAWPVSPARAVGCTRTSSTSTSRGSDGAVVRPRSWSRPAREHDRRHHPEAVVAAGARRVDARFDGPDDLTGTGVRGVDGREADSNRDGTTDQSPKWSTIVVPADPGEVRAARNLDHGEDDSTRVPSVCRLVTVHVGAHR